MQSMAGSWRAVNSALWVPLGRRTWARSREGTRNGRAVLDRAGGGPAALVRARCKRDGLGDFDYLRPRISRITFSYFFSSPCSKPTCVYLMTPTASRMKAGQPKA